jgi:hypothetical protein
LRDDEGWLGGAVGGFVGAGDVVEVVVHADEAGDYGVVVEVDDLSVGVRGRVFGDAGNFAVFDEDGLVFKGRGAGAVDDADVGEKDRGGVDFDVLENVRGGSGGLGLKVEGKGKEQGWGHSTGEARAHVCLRWDEFTLRSVRSGRVS